MTDFSPTRSAVVEMKDERRAMHEGYVFLDEKCLLLAGEILRELAHYSRLQREFLALNHTALGALQEAVARHGLAGLQVYPADDLSACELQTVRRSLMGVRLQQAELIAHAVPAPTALDASPEARDCRLAFAALLAAAAPLAAVAGNLERLSREYRRTVRRARALQDVMLPELDGGIREIEGRLEELEQEDAVSMRRSALLR